MEEHLQSQFLSRIFTLDRLLWERKWPKSVLFFGTKNMVTVNLMATVLYSHGFDKSKLVYAGEIQKWNYRMEMTTYFSKQEGEICNC